MEEDVKRAMADIANEHKVKKAEDAARARHALVGFIERVAGKEDASSAELSTMCRVVEAVFGANR